MPARVLNLLAAIAVLAVIWLIALPWAAGQPKMARHLEWLEQEKIDPSAMYYTELEMMKPILTRLALEQRKTLDP